MKSLYLTGGNGFIGKNIVNGLFQQYDITVFDKIIDTDFFVHRENVKTVKIDLVHELIPWEFPTPDYLINLASMVTAERDLQLFQSLIASNVTLLLNLFERFKNDNVLKILVQFGSAEEYGHINSPFKENVREYPNSPYALIKQLTTNTGIMLYKNYGFPMTIIRPGNLFGPQQPKSKFLPYIINKLRANESLEVTFCEQKRDFIYVIDFVNIVKKLLFHHSKCVGEIINISSGKSISLKAVIEFCKKELKSHSIIKYGALPYRENEIMDLKFDLSKVQNILNEDISIDIKKSLKEYLNQNK